VERFDRKDPEPHSIELANLKQTRSTEASIVEFQRLAVMVSNIVEEKLIMLLIERLVEPL